MGPELHLDHAETRTYLDLDAMKRQGDARIATDRARAADMLGDAEREEAVAANWYRRVLRASRTG